MKSVVKSQDPPNTTECDEKGTENSKRGFGVSDFDLLVSKVSKNEFGFLKQKNPDIPHLELY